MIVSASRRTDIPAFYAKWFVDRLREGFAVCQNPFNRKQMTPISLRPEDVEAIVFWTKNPHPLLSYLSEIDRMGHRYYFHFTLNCYPRAFEPRVPELAQRIKTFKMLSDEIGAERVIWRYDPIILSSITGIDYHLRVFGKIAKELRSYTARVVISFLDIYGKVRQKLERLRQESGIETFDISGELFETERCELLAGISEIARENGIEAMSCCEEIDVSKFQIQRGACIDRNLIESVFGVKVNAGKDKNQRGNCLCATSADVGAYNTCRFACTYCYANYSEEAVSRNLRLHNPQSPLLCGTPERNLPQQTTLFDIMREENAGSGINLSGISASLGECCVCDEKEIR